MLKSHPDFFAQKHKSKSTFLIYQIYCLFKSKQGIPILSILALCDILCGNKLLLHFKFSFWWFWLFITKFKFFSIFNIQVSVRTVVWDYARRGVGAPHQFRLVGPSSRLAEVFICSVLLLLSIFRLLNIMVNKILCRFVQILCV